MVPLLPEDGGGVVVPLLPEDGGVEPVDEVPVEVGLEGVAVVPLAPDPLEDSNEEVERTPAPQPVRARTTKTHIPPRDFFQYIKLLG